MASKTLVIFGNYGAFGAYYIMRMRESICADVVLADELSERIGIAVGKIHKDAIKKIRSYFFNYDKIISFVIRKDTVLYFLLCSKNIRFIFYEWNTIELKDYRSWRLYFLKLIHKDVYTFDKGDALRYRWGYNPQFYFCQTSSKQGFEDNIGFFCGRNKGRKRILEEIALRLNKNNIKTNIIIVDEKGRLKSDIVTITNKEMDYSIILENVEKSQYIIDITKGIQSGLTARTLEAVFSNKRIITNNLHIADEKFFCHKKIYILKNEFFDGFIEFLEGSECLYDKDSVEYYSYDNWVSRFS